MRMHSFSLSLLSLLPLTTGLQPIYLGYIENIAEVAYLAWFSNSSDACTEGTTFGSQGSGKFAYCDKDLTISDHTNITFTGCCESSTSRPKGVSDGGAPALKCAPASSPPGGVHCAANGGAGFVGLLEYCS